MHILLTAMPESPGTFWEQFTGHFQAALENSGVFLADALWALFYGLMGAEMSGAAVYLADPGTGPVPLGRGTDGVFEYAINLTMTCKKE